jgi:hypothetical protein
MSFRSNFSDGSPDHTSPHRKGYRFADCDARDESEAAYRERQRRLHNADHSQLHRDGGPTLDESRAGASEAYEERRERLQSAHRSRRQEDLPETPFEKRMRQREADRKKYDV